MPISPGDQFDYAGNHYTIGPLIQAGGMAAAYNAVQEHKLFGTFMLKKDVVAKVPNGWVLSQPDLMHRFMREARILGNVDHSNIVKMIGLHEMPDGTPVIIQELVPNAFQLDAYIQARPASAPSLYLQALYALRAMHPTIVHRDATPSNLLVDAHGRLRLIDFGLAFEDPRQTQVLTKAGITLGTPGCIAPEVYKDPSNADGRADIFSVGKSFAAAVGGTDPMNVMVHRLSAPWNTICEKACEHDRDQRYANAEEAIEHALQLFGGNSLENMQLHLEEHQRPSVSTPPTWPYYCISHTLGLAAFVESDLLPASLIPSGYFATNNWGPQMFDMVEASAAMNEIAGRRVIFDSLDYFGGLYVNLYPHLDQARKEQCYRRLIRASISMTRYPVMGMVRTLYAQEQDPQMKARLLAVLNFEDPPPTNTIYGRNIIPGRAF